MPPIDVDQIAQEIIAAGDNDAALANIASRYGLDPAFVASIGAGTSRTTLGQAFSPSLLIGAGIISPEVLGTGFDIAEQEALRKAMQDWDKAYADLLPDAPTFSLYTESKYPDAALIFETVRSGVPVDDVLLQPSVVNYKNALMEQSVNLGNQFTKDLEEYADEWDEYSKKMFDFTQAGNSAKTQAAILALGERPSANPTIFAEARMDFAKELGIPALSLLPDPRQKASVTEAEVQSERFGGDTERARRVDEYRQQFLDRVKNKPSMTSSSGYGGMLREPEGVAPLESIPLSARGGSGMDVYQRIADTPESERMRGLRGFAATGGSQLGRERRGRIQAIRDEDERYADEIQQIIDASRNRATTLARSRKNTPFERALQQYQLFGALEANS